MRLSPQNIAITALLLLPWIAARREPRCPIGFQVSYTYNGSPICYRLKEPEAFSDKFQDCTGNLYSSKLYHNLNFTKTKQILWTEYKSMYPGGPFIDWSYTDSTGDILLTTYDVKYDSSLGIDEELCVLIDPVSNFTAARCDEKHHRYCFVKPYDEDERSTTGCKEDGFQRFYSPLSTCLTAVTGVGGGTVRATWKQAQELCAKRRAALMYRGWRYSNSPSLHVSGSLPNYPMGVVMNANGSQLRYETENDTSEIPQAEWKFHSLGSRSSDLTFGAIRNDFWRLVNSSFIFFDVICERSLPLRNISLELYHNWDTSITLRVDNVIKKNEIHCFTDSLIYYPKEVSISRLDDLPYGFQVNTPADGYYWCIQMDHKNYHVSESNKALYIRSLETVTNLYACKIRLKREYRFKNLDKLDVWKKKLEEYIYYRTKYLAIYGEIPSNGTEAILKAFKNERLDLDWKDTDVTYSLSIKRLYLDARTILVHLRLNPEMEPAAPGNWSMIEVEFMRPAYYCKGFDSVPTAKLGESAASAGCRNYTCVGDFNEGVQWVETGSYNCTATTRVSSSVDLELAMPTATPYATWNSPITDLDLNAMHVSDDNSSSEEKWPPWTRPPPPPTETTTEVEWSFTTVNDVTTDLWELTTSPAPVTTTTLPPEEQLHLVVEELEQLLQAETVTIESMGHSFDQVNEILDVDDPNLEIPGRLLHLLDALAFRVELKESEHAIEVRDNVALMMADATPERPVRGVRVAAREYDTFSNESFGFIDSSPNTEQLLRNSSEAVVYLPASVSSTPRRVSFIAFRNQRAFPSAMPLNSRVFSVNVENMTHFEDGEVIDIHLSPIVDDPERNQSRACAYWHFTSNDTGHWSQEGCTLIRAADAEAMDTCRCTHLTHFAEVLVPRTVFSEQNETALEILSIIGCALSIFGLLMIALTASLFRSWRRDYSNKIWLQLCVAIFILVVCFLAVVFANFETYDVPCMLVGVALHYSVLASFCWMLVAAVLSYRRLVLVFTRDMSHKLLRASAFSWGTPCAIVGILLSVDPQSYQGRFEDMAPSGAFCYPSGLGLWLAVYTPIVIMLLANWTLFILIVRSVFASRRIQRHGDSNEALRCASVSCLLVFLFGLPWIFGLFAYNVVAAYLFTLTATYQGFVLFIFFVLGNKKTRDLWLNKLKIKQTRKVPVTSSTYTNRSTGPGWRAGAEGGTSIEAKASKPRSLTSPDDSRFS